MEIFLLPLFLAWLTLNKFVDSQRNFQNSIQRDIKELNAACRPFDSCAQKRIIDSLDIYTCQCGAICIQYGTCCLDSPHSIAKSPKIRQNCRSTDKTKYYFMIDHCPESDSVWQSMCEEEWNGEDDVMRIVPVTSLVTNSTYKNYFCFRCHEMTTDDFFYWNITLGSYSNEIDQAIQERPHVFVTYDQQLETWLAPLGKFDANVPVSLMVDIPKEPWPLPVACVPQVISSCDDDWSETDARRKCEAYMGRINIKRNKRVFKYRNVHCAKCNFENVKSMSCEDRDLNVKKEVSKERFSFTTFLKPTANKKCTDNYLWDRYHEVCRKHICVRPGLVVKDGRCQRK